MTCWGILLKKIVLVCLIVLAKFLFANSFCENFNIYNLYMIYKLYLLTQPPYRKLNPQILNPQTSAFEDSSEILNRDFFDSYRKILKSLNLYPVPVFSATNPWIHDQQSTSQHNSTTAQQHNTKRAQQHTCRLPTANCQLLTTDCQLNDHY